MDVAQDSAGTVSPSLVAFNHMLQDQGRNCNWKDKYLVFQCSSGWSKAWKHRLRNETGCLC